MAIRVYQTGWGNYRATDRVKVGHRFQDLSETGNTEDQAIANLQALIARLQASQNAENSNGGELMT